MKHQFSSRRLLLWTLPWISVFFNGGRFLSAQTPPACQQLKYILSNPNNFDAAGRTVDMSSDFMFVGRPTEASMLTGPISSVFIFKAGVTPGSWINTQEILDPRDDGTESLFGQRLNVDANRLIVTMVREESPSGIIGAAAIFRLDVATNTWLLEQKLFPFNGTGGLGDVAIDGDFAVMGQGLNDHGGIRAGAAFVFRFDGTSWIEEAEFFASDRATDDKFGWSLAIFGDIIIVGAPFDDDLGNDSGSVYVYRRVAGSWINVGKINAPDGAAGDVFGVAVDYDGTTLAIGAPGHDFGGLDIGAVYLYRNNGLPGWEYITKLTPPPSADGPNDGFGLSVDIDIDRLFIGAWVSGYRGSAHVYRNTGAGWEYVLRLVPQDSFSDRFGFAVAIHNGNVVIGAPHDNQAGIDAGAVYTHSNIFIADCDGNCVMDATDILLDPSLDCNLNGIMDACDLTFDCNLNGIPDDCEDCDNNGFADECDLNPVHRQGSGSLSPIGLGSDVFFTFVRTGLPLINGDVTFDFTASADLGSTFISIEVFLNGVTIGEVFDATGTNCAINPDEDQIIVPLVTFESIVGVGDIDILMVAVSSDPFACGGANFVTVDISFITPPLINIDTNDNGIIDACECPADCANGSTDTYINVTDLLSLLANWGSSPTYCDIAPPGGDGTVNVTDLLDLLAAWGACTLP